jgi:hypothetical protein
MRIRAQNFCSTLWKSFLKKNTPFYWGRDTPKLEKIPKELLQHSTARKANNNKKEKLEIVNFSRVFPQVYRRFSLYCLVVNKKKEKVGLQF